MGKGGDGSGRRGRNGSVVVEELLEPLLLTVGSESGAVGDGDHEDGGVSGSREARGGKAVPQCL